MATIVPACSGPVLHKIQYGFFEHKQLETRPYDREVASLVVQTEFFLQEALRSELKDSEITVKAVNISWEYHEQQRADNRPFQLSFVLHVKGRAGWMPQNVILHAMEKLNFQPYILDFIWKVHTPEGKDENVFKGVNSVNLESAQNMDIPRGQLPEGVPAGAERQSTAPPPKAKKEPSKEVQATKEPKPDAPTGEPVAEEAGDVPEAKLEPVPEPELEPEVGPAEIVEVPIEEPASQQEKDEAIVTSGKRTFDDIYELDQELGRGAFSVVKLGHNRETKDPYAIKMIIKAEMQEFDKMCLESEISVLQQLPPHQHIIKIFDVFDEADYIHLVLEKVDGGELLDRLIQKSNYTEFEARDVCKIVMQAIGHCHMHKVAHRDLKPENLLLTSPTDDSSIKVADFGFAKKCPGPESLITQCGSAQHVSPEILNNVPYGVKVDMWALGVIMYTIIGGCPPFYDSTNQGTFQKILNGEYKFDALNWGHVSEDCKDVISNLLTFDPRERWSTEQCLDSRWIKGDPSVLSSISLRPNQLRLQEHQAKQKMKAAVYAVIGMNRLHDIGEGGGF